jgi:uncharacterized lipoprotein YajG
MLKRFAIVLGLAILTGCSTTSVGLKYGAIEGGQPARIGATVSVGTFVDKRNEDPRWLGAIRGGFGNPLKTLQSSQPVSEVVQAAYIDAVKARGMNIAPSAPLEIAGTIIDLNCTQMSHREATVVLELTVTEKATGQRRFAQTYSAKSVSQFQMAGGILAPIEDLRRDLEKTLGEAIDKSLNDPRFTAAMTQTNSKTAAK